MSDKNRTKPWGEQEKSKWLEKQSIKRSYQQQVVEKIDALAKRFNVSSYGALSTDSESYPLLVIKTRSFNANLPTIFITGGVHGYETSGVQGALRFMAEQAGNYQDRFNFICAPCVSPWGYETINRWNPKALDPNRSFFTNSPAEESAQLMAMMAAENVEVLAHFDLHETTDTDNSVFLPDLAARDGSELIIWEIPDGFYAVGDSEQPQDDFQTAIINAVKQVTHIAPDDEHGCIIGEKISQPGVINYPVKKLGLCAGVTNARYRTTTEVYPDSPQVTDEECILAQVAALKGGLDYLAALNE